MQVRYEINKIHNASDEFELSRLHQNILEKPVIGAGKIFAYKLES